MTLAAFEYIPIRECGDPLVDLRTFPLLLECRYFMQGISPSPGLYARLEVARKLTRVQSSLGPNFRLKIWDPWRPRAVQHAIYQRYWSQLRAEQPSWTEERLREQVGTFVTFPGDPHRIPPHATGGAVDLTLANVEGNDLDMGTEFDHFGVEAASLFYEHDHANPVIRRNRRLLRDAMEAEDFRIDDDEWWHFDYGNQLWARHGGHSFAIYDEISTVAD
jgi:D-alanyl-D-alanine dipeptidase